MSQAFLSMDAVRNGAKLALKHIDPYRGIGVTRLLFTFEVTCKQQSAVGAQIWLGGWVDTLNLPAHTTLYLASFRPPTQPAVLGQLGGDQSLQLSLEVTEQQLHLIEETRTSGTEIYIHLSGHAVQDGKHLVISEEQITHDISQSDWLMLLQRAGYRPRLLVELEPPDPAAYPELARAIDFYLQAERHYREGEWRLTVESMRQCLADLVGKKADEEADVTQAFKAIRNEARSASVGYGPRRELVRQAMKFMCDLGAHPEVAETRRHDAYGALVMGAGLLHAFTRS